jgi:flagellar biosynthesis protein FliR
MNQLLTQFGTHNVVAFFLVLARVSPMFVFAPLFSSKLVPVRVRGIIAVALAVGLSPVVGRGAHIPLDVLSIGGMVAKELLVGLAFAFALGALFGAVQVAGSFLDTLIGFSFGSLVDPVTGNNSSVLSQMYALLAVLIFIAIGGDSWVLQGLARTYDVIGLDQAPSIPALVGGANRAFVDIFASAIQIAGPVVLALILTDAAFGVVSRVVPQLNVFAVGFPAKVTVGLILMGVSLPFFGGWLADQLQQSVSSALQTLKVA